MRKYSNSYDDLTKVPPLSRRSMMRAIAATSITGAGLTSFGGTVSSAAVVDDQIASNGISQPTHGIINPAGVYSTDADKTFVTYSGGLGLDPYVVTYDHSSDTWSSPVKAGNNPLDNDDHGDPAIERGPNGYLHVFYGTHNDPCEYARSTNPDDASSWDDMGTVQTGRHTYSAPRTMNGDIYLFYRVQVTTNDRSLAFVKSSDGGDSWTNPRIIFKYDEHWIYTGSNAVDSQGCIHHSMLRASLPDQYRRDAFHAIYDPSDDNMYSIDGTNLGPTVNKTEAENHCKVFDSGTEGTNTVRIRLDSNDNPHVMFVHNNSGTFEYRYVYWTESGWTSPMTITQAGNIFNAGWMFLDAADDIHAYLTVSAGSRTGDIEHWHYDGSSWVKWETVRSARSVDNALGNPVEVRNAHPDVEVIYSEMDPNNWTEADLKVFADSINDSDKGSPCTGDLIGHYELEQDATDSTCYGHDGAEIGLLQYSTNAKRGNYAFQGDGSNGYIQLADQSNDGYLHDAFSTRSVALWVNPDTTTDTQILFDEGGARTGLSIKIDDGTLKSTVRNNGPRTTASTSFTNTSSWTHVATVFNNGTLSLYKNGIKTDSVSAKFSTVSSHSDEAILGARGDYATRGESKNNGKAVNAHFDGRIDDVRIYSDVLTDVEVGVLSGNVPNPLAYYRLEGNALDSSGNRYDGKEMDSPQYSPIAHEGSQAYLGDGTDGYIQLVGSDGSGYLHDAFSTRSVALWVNPDITTGTQVLFDEGGSANGFGVRIKNDTLETAVVNDRTQYTASVSFTDTSSWTHIAAIFDHGKLELYKNGNLADSVAATYSTVGGHRDEGGIGARVDDAAFGEAATSDPLGDHTDGLIDSVLVYDEALTDSEVNELANL